MALSVIVIPGDGVTTQFSIPFALGYNKQSDITCRVGDEQDGTGNPIYRTLTFLSETLVSVSGPAATVDQRVVFTRTVPREQLIVDFEDGDIINEENMNTAQKQSIMLIHEVLDGRFGTFNDDIDMGGFRIQNVGAPVNPGDAANKAYVDSRLTTSQQQVVEAKEARDTAVAASITATGASQSAAASQADAAASKVDAANSAASAAGDASSATLSANDASSSKSAAAASAALAKRWAAEEPNVPVESGLFSARHYAALAAGVSLDALMKAQNLADLPNVATARSNLGLGTAAVANSATLLARANHTGTQSADTIVDSGTKVLMTPAERTKLAGVATGATANSPNATLLARANHTGTQPSSTISDFDESVDDRVAALLKPGANVTMVYDDAANTLTIGATGNISTAATAVTVAPAGNISSTNAQAALQELDAEKPQLLNGKVQDTNLKLRDTVGEFHPLRLWAGFTELNAAWSRPAGQVEFTDVDGYLHIKCLQDVYVFSRTLPGAEQFNGTEGRYIAIRWRPTAGTRTNGLFYATSGHGFAEAYRSTVETVALGDWSTSVFDMWASTNPADWKSSTITSLRMDIANRVNAEADVAWIAIFADRPPNDPARNDARYAQLAGSNVFTANQTIFKVNPEMLIRRTAETAERANVTYMRADGTRAWLAGLMSDTDVPAHGYGVLRRNASGGAAGNPLTIDPTTGAVMLGETNGPTTAIGGLKHVKGVLSTGQNADDILDAGFYSCNNLVGAPYTTPWWYMEVQRFSTNNSWVLQRIVNLSTTQEFSPEWERRRVNGVWSAWYPSCGFLTPEHFGARGDGVNGDAGPVESMLRSTLRCPMKLISTYLINREITFGSAYNSGYVDLSGTGRQHLIFSTNDARLFYTGPVPTSFGGPLVSLRDFGIRVTAAAHGPEAIAVHFADGGSGTTGKTVDISNIDIRGSSTTTGPGSGIDLYNATNAQVDRCVVQGKRNLPRNSRQGYGVRFRGQSNPVDANFSDNKFYFLSFGILTTGTPEGLTIDRHTVVACDTAVWAEWDENPVSGDNAGKPLLKITNSHFNTSLYGVCMTRVRDYQIQNVDFLVDGANQNWVGIRNQQESGASEYGDIDRCKFEDANGLSSATTAGIVLNGASTGVLNSVIGVNRYVSMTVGIALQGNARNVRYQQTASIFANVSAAVVNDGGASNVAV